MDIIQELCKKYTDLTDEEIATIQGMSAVLQPLANLEDADIFIDCPSWDGDAIVVAEAKPSYVPSSYKKTVVGLLARKENEPAVARTFRLGVATKQMKAVTQENGRTIQSVEPIRNATGDRVIGVLIREQRVDEQRQISERLHFSEQSYERIANALAHMVGSNNWLTECIDEALLMVDKSGVVTFRNSLARDLYRKLGYIDDPLGQPYENVRLVDSWNDMDQSGFSVIETTVGRHSLSIKRIQLDSEDMAFAVVIQDLTWKKEQEKALILKSVAIKEMHHRVKNNLQTIASLLRLQVRRSDNEETRKVLGESMNRILSIATTHELLAQSGVDQVKIGEVILNIKNNTVRYFARPHFDVNITLEGDDFEVDSDIATSVALIINELLQNSLQYAFQDREKGLVRIVVTRGELYSRIEVIDDGSGYDVENVRTDRLGLSIVQTMVKDKLRGTLDVESGPGGTHVTFEFKNQIMDAASVT
ncbi:MAG TPA: sensor histidine kinase [Candidatus Intestinimonas pullistercoris]|uniref:histidine kinase n=1 Tax=Candidatus Intestinimonas pullistercoris TaxID=2838623 RepID=A0A9D2NZT3_9FIRM|nr:sensor histidine kinase [uncultured Intestinimonas sp.]HJC40957.1 sensor histidine kinase [Candidatus Intestinimonas pullistercoris]